MISRISRKTRKSRLTAGALLAVWLNLALLPCAMALETVEEGHDCCPPTIELQALDCCEPGDVCVDSRSEYNQVDKTALVAVQVAAPPTVALVRASHHDPPPDPACTVTPIYLANCVFLD